MKWLGLIALALGLLVVGYYRLRAAWQTRRFKKQTVVVQ